MAKPRLRLRELTADEQTEIERLARSRATSNRLVEQAWIIRLAQQGQGVSAIARRLQISRPTVYGWLERFNPAGLAGLADEPRSGRPPTYTPDAVGVVIATALTAPAILGLPFASWTLDRLEAYLNEERGLHIKRSRIDELLLAEGLRWRQQEKWFGKRVDPDFAEKRGPSKRSTPRRRKTVLS
jgi:transposase